MPILGEDPDYNKRPETTADKLLLIIGGLVFALLMLAELLRDFQPAKASALFFLPAWFVMLVIHELGHAGMARLCGWRVRAISIGVGRNIWKSRMGETDINIGLFPISGFVLPQPRDMKAVRLKSALIYAAGPGVELLIAGALILALGPSTFFESDNIGRVCLDMLVVVAVFGAMVNLLPFRSSQGTQSSATDGLGIILSFTLPREEFEKRLKEDDNREEAA